MRLKILRESIEDYEYIEILKSLGEGEFALNTVKQVARDWKKWTRDHKKLIKSRKVLGEKIHSLNSQEATTTK
jgi:hypothetical protein